MTRPTIVLLVTVLVAASCASGSQTSDSATTALAPPDTTATTTTSPLEATVITTTAPAETTAEPTTAPAAAATTEAPSSASAGGWVEHQTGSDCKCASGTDYNFWTRDASQTKVVFYLEGGGACFSADTCSFTDGTYSVYAGHKGSPADAGGMFSLSRKANPFADWSFIYMPYCTGDVHIGNSVHEYAPGLVVNHNGSRNVQHGLDYLSDHYPDATEVFVMGSSAGGVAAPLYGGLISDILPNANISVLADGAGSYPDIPDLNAQLADLWGSMSVVPDWSVNAGMTAQDWSLPGLYVQSGLHDPSIRMARFDYARDRVQAGFTDAAGVGSNDRMARLDQNEINIEAAGVNLSVYVAPGDKHTILKSNKIFQMSVEGVPFLDWLTSYVNGEVVPDVHCQVCGP